MQSVDEKRTLKQNSAMHKYFELVSDAARDSGVTFTEFLNQRPKLDMHWTPTRVKELWKEIVWLLYRKDSTAKLTKSEIDQVYDVFNKAIAEVMGIHIPFPSEEVLQEAYGNTIQD